MRYSRDEGSGMVGDVGSMYYDSLGCGLEPEEDGSGFRPLCIAVVNHHKLT